MKYILSLTLISLAILSGCSKDVSTDKIWDAFGQAMGSADRMKLKEAKIIKSGKVNAKHLYAATASTSDYPAYLVQFKYNMEYPGIGDQDEAMYVYYILDTDKDKETLMWRGDNAIDELYSEMQQDEFK